MESALSPRGHLEDALSHAEAAATARTWRLRHPVRSLRPVVRRWAGPSECVCEIFTGQRMRVVLPEIVGTQLYRHRYIEGALTRVLIDHLRPGMVFVDVGAHYGYFSLVASVLVGPAGAVFALEPGRHAFDLLARNVRDVPVIHPDAVAACSHTGTGELHDFGVGNSALNTLLGMARVPPEDRRRLRSQAYPVRCSALDDYIAASGGVPDFVKIDAEGSELAILTGMRTVLTEAAPMLAIEAGDYDGMTAPPTMTSIEFLESLGYRCLEYADGLQPHRRRLRYGYDNLYFVKE